MYTFPRPTCRPSQTFVTTHLGLLAGIGSTGQLEAPRPWVYWLIEGLLARRLTFLFSKRRLFFRFGLILGCPGGVAT